MKSEFQVTRKYTRTPICECDQLHVQVHLTLNGLLLVKAGALSIACRKV